MIRKANKWICAVLALTLAGAIFAGCASSEENVSSEPTPSPKATATPAPTAEPTATPVPLKVIGEESETAYKVVLENGTEQNVTVFSVKSSSEEEFPESMLPEKELFAADEKRALYVEKEADEKQAKGEKLLDPQYDIRFMLEDGREFMLHAFPFGDIEEGVIKIEGEIAYLEYTSVESKKPISTKEAELAVLESEKAEAEQENWVEEPADEPVYEEPSYEEPEYEEPVYEPEEPDDGGEGGCLDDGLFN